MIEFWFRLRQTRFRARSRSSWSPGGRIVIPVGDEHSQTLLVGDKTSAGELRLATLRALHFRAAGERLTKAQAEPTVRVLKDIGLAPTR